VQLQNVRVLVTGAEGFIGSTLCDLLLDKGANVRAFAHYKPYAERGWLAGRQEDLEVVAGDIRDPERVNTAVAGCDVVLHLAALIGIPYSYEAPDSYVQTNVVGTQNILNACRRASVQRLVHTSTSEVYGSAISIPIDEQHPLQPQSPYSASKIGADMLAMSYWHSFGLPVAIARPFNTYGPRQSMRAVIPTILGQLHSGAQEISLGSTAPSRDFTFVQDTVAGFLSVASCERAIGHAINIGSGREVSVGELAQLLIEVSGRDAEILVDEARLRPAGSEVDRLCCDNRRAREWCGWAPQYELENGLRITSDWVREHVGATNASRYSV
jgi:NAD dependent epimerase/dehydratase